MSAYPVVAVLVRPAPFVTVLPVHLLSMMKPIVQHCAKQALLHVTRVKLNVKKLACAKPARDHSTPSVKRFDTSYAETPKSADFGVFIWCDEIGIKWLVSLFALNRRLCFW